LFPSARRPSYELELIQQLVGQGPLSFVITSVARVGARECGFLNVEEIVEAVLELTPANFYKTMESETFPGLWQDVYHLSSGGSSLYIKLQISLGGAAVIVQFKRR